MTRKRFLSLGLWVAAVVLAGWLCLQGGTTDTNPPITQIATIHQWHLGRPDGIENAQYLWLNDHEVLHLSGDEAHGYHPVSEDTRSHTTRSEQSLEGVQTGRVVSIAPNSQWVLWAMRQEDYDIPVMAATRRPDGKTVYWRFLNLEQGLGFWLPDGHRWISIADVLIRKANHGPKTAERRFILCDLNHPECRRFPIPGDTGDSSIMGVTTTGKIILSETLGDRGNASSQGQALLPLTEVTLTGNRPQARQILMPVPVTPPNINSLFYLSPQGDRMLWVSTSFGPPTPIRRLANWVRRVQGGDVTSKDIWICHLNGTMPTHLGTWHSPDFGAVCWNPDGKHISLTMANGLYSIAVP